MDEELFNGTYHVRQVEKCCGTCKHFERCYEDCWCAHPKRIEMDGGCTYLVDEGFICDLWEASKTKEQP